MASYKLVCIFAAALFSAVAWAGAPEDFEAGRELYRKGDVRAAISLLRKSADTGHAASQSLVGSLLDRSEENEDAVRYYKLAAAQGDREGHYGLAVMQLSGEGTPRDLAAARQSMMSAGQLGHHQATATLALSYIKGGLDLKREERDSPEALKWIQAAAANDHLESLDRLAIAYRKAELGLESDVKQAEALEARAKAIRGDRPGTISKKKSRSRG